MKLIAFILTRGMYGKLAPLIKFARKKGAEIDVFVGGSVTSKLGNLQLKIKEDIGINFCSNYALENDETIHEVIACDLIKKLCPILRKNNYDYGLIVGDRYEMLSVATSCLLTNTKILHIEGGERSGSIDESIRHALSKLAHLHCVSSEFAFNYLVSIGENEKRILISGSPNFDLIRDFLETNKSKINKLITFNQKEITLKDKEYLSIIHHPIIYDEISYEEQLSILISAVKSVFSGKVVIVSPNLDSDALKYINLITKSNDNLLIFCKSLDPKSYALLIKQSILAIGNSSSLIREAPFIGTRSLVIGNRQFRRNSANSVHHCNLNEKEISEKIKEIIKLPSPYPSTLYGDGFSSDKIFEFIKKNIQIPLQK